MNKLIALILSATLAACAAGCGLIAYGGWWLIAVGAACVLFAFLYTAGPYPLAYHGWGDMLVLLFFGFVPVCCTYYVLCSSRPWLVAVFAAAWRWHTPSWRHVAPSRWWRTTARCTRCSSMPMRGRPPPSVACPGRSSSAT